MKSTLEKTLLLIVLTASVIGCITLINWKRDGQESIPITEKPEENRALQISAAASSTQISSSSDKADQENDLIEELLSFLPEDINDRTILYAGSQVMEVEGLYIDEDSESGFVSVTGLTKISLLDGRSLNVGGDDATMNFEPASGKVEIVSDSVTLYGNWEQR